MYVPVGQLVLARTHTHTQVQPSILHPRGRILILHTNTVTKL